MTSKYSASVGNVPRSNRNYSRYSDSSSDSDSDDNVPNLRSRKAASVQPVGRKAPVDREKNLDSIFDSSPYEYSRKRGVGRAFSLSSLSNALPGGHSRGDWDNAGYVPGLDPVPNRIPSANYNNERRTLENETNAPWTGVSDYNPFKERVKEGFQTALGKDEFDSMGYLPRQEDYYLSRSGTTPYYSDTRNRSRDRDRERTRSPREGYAIKERDRDRDRDRDRERTHSPRERYTTREKDRDRDRDRDRERTRSPREGYAIKERDRDRDRDRERTRSPREGYTTRESERERSRDRERTRSPRERYTTRESDRERSRDRDMESQLVRELDRKLGNNSDLPKKHTIDPRPTRVDNDSPNSGRRRSYSESSTQSRLMEQETVLRPRLCQEFQGMPHTDDDSSFYNVHMSVFVNRIEVKRDRCENARVTLSPMGLFVEDDETGELLASLPSKVITAAYVSRDKISWIVGFVADKKHSKSRSRNDEYVMVLTSNDAPLMSRTWKRLIARPW